MFELGKPMTVTGECSEEIVDWIKEAENDILIKDYLKEHE